MALKDHPLIFILLLLVFLVYFDSFNNSFVWDDHAFVVENKSLREPDFKKTLSYFYDRNTVSSNEELSRDVWRPLVTSSFAIDYRFWGLEPRFYHIENVLIHAANTVLVYIITFLILGSPLAAFITGLVFSIHPVQTGAVTWISGRSNVLFLLFFLLSLRSHIKMRIRGYCGGYYSLSIIFFFLSLLSKEMAITLPVVLVLYDIHFYKKESIRKLTSHYLPYVLITIFYLVSRYAVLGKVGQREMLWGGGVLQHCLVMITAIAGYIKMLFLPVKLRAEYMLNIPKSILDLQLVFSLAVILAAGIVYFLCRRKRQISFYILFFFVTLIPVSNLVPFKAVMAERFLYLPSIAFASLTALLYLKLKGMTGDRKALLLLNTACILILTLYGLATIGRNIEWRNELIFSRTEVERSSSNPRFYYNLGLAYLNEGDKNRSSRELSRSYYALAIKAFEGAVKLKPDFVWAYINMGNTYERLDFKDLAINNFKKALTLKEEPGSYNNLGVVYYNKGMYDDAIDAFRKALLLDIHHQNVSLNLGNAYFMKKDYRRAKIAWASAIRLGVGNEDTAARMRDLERLGY